MLPEFVDGKEKEKEVEEELRKRLDDLKSRISDPMERDAVGKSLESLQIADLRSSAFENAKIEKQSCQNLLELSKVKDDKELTRRLKEADFEGLKSLLGPAADELFLRRLTRIEEALKVRISLAKQSISNPISFGKEIQNLRAAQEEVGEHLELHQDTCKSFLYFFYI